MGPLLEKAAISRTGPNPDADAKVVVTGLVKPRDSFTLVWSVVNRRPVKTEVRTDLDGDPVQVAIDYAALPDGPFYAARTMVTAAKKDIRITIETFDYARSGGAAK